MLDKDAFKKLHRDFIDSEGFIECAHDRRKGMKFVCHHNAFLVAWFLRHRGHKDVWLTDGYYECHPGTNSRIRHSWIALVTDQKMAAIFEFDPHQLHKGGGYENDPMPHGDVPDFPMPIPVVATIVDPQIIELPEELEKSKWVVKSTEILARYIPDDTVAPEIEIADLGKLASDAMRDLEASRRLLEEGDLE